MINRLPASMTTGMQDMVLVVGMIAILMILFVPISTGVLDFLLLSNFSFALLILLLTFYTEKPLEFSTFPSLLLMTTLFRLSLNVSTTRLILQQGDAGAVINSVGEHVVAGNYVIGLVIFFILIVVQYIVVTNGAQRVAEVAARFTLDSLPGKQMSIDADLNMGLIDTEEAKNRRSNLEKESNFYGAMDGASKFVKGDAIAGIIIILINIVGGLSIGIFQLGMTWVEALHHYTLLTVGDGIVTQIPSLIIAVAAGIIITRAASDARLGVEVVKQFTLHPRTIFIVLIALVIQAFIPGIPLVPIAVLLLLFGVLYWFVVKKKLNEGLETVTKELEEAGEAKDLYAEITTSPFEVHLGADLHTFFVENDSDIEMRISVLRKNLANELGFVLPTLNFKRDPKLKQSSYKIFIHGESMASGSLIVDKLLAINSGDSIGDIDGVDAREPTYGLPAKWIALEHRTHAQTAGCTVIEADSVFLTHIQETIKRNAAHFISRVEVEKLLTSRKDELGNMLEEVIPNVLSYSDLQRVLQGLLNEQIPIKNLPLIMDVVCDVSRSIKDPDEIVEKCRERMRATICDSVADSEGKVHVITLAPSLERKLVNTFINKDGTQAGLSPQELDVFMRKVIKEADGLLRKNISPVILCAGHIRRHLRQLVKSALPLAKILSVNEIDEKINIVSAGIVNIETSGDSNV